jgi:hypothetical protein
MMLRPALLAILIAAGGIGTLRLLPDGSEPTCPPKGGHVDPAGALTFDSTEVDRDAVVSSDTPEFYTTLESGRVVARFVIDSSGHPDLETLSIEPTRDSDLAQEVRQFIPKARFVPAQLDGCRVRVWARWPFVVQDGKEVQT